MKVKTTFLALIVALAMPTMAQAQGKLLKKIAPKKAATETPTDVTVTKTTATTATVDWTPASEETTWNLRYRKFTPTAMSWDVNDLNQIEGFIVYDGDGDGYNWSVTQLEEGNNCFFSESWNTNGVLTPDNWLIFPKATLGGKVSFYAWGTYPDVFGVFISTEETITSVGNFVQIGTDTAVVAEKTLYEYDLSLYAGQEGYIAIRHYNCTDQFRLLVDDITIEFPEGTVTPEEWTEVDGITEKPYTITGLETETEYEAQVQAVFGDGATSGWTESTRFITANGKAAITDVKADNITTNSADISWTANGTETKWKIRYREADTSFACDFEEDADTVGWKMIDADGDGHNWMYSSGEGLNCIGNGCVSSESYINNTGPLTPDNWLVTPKVTFKGELSFAARGQDPNYPAEVFAVYVSTTSNSDVSTFTKISDDITATGEITTYTFDLSEYEGQEGYVAIRHYNVTDMFKLNIDNVTIGNYGEWIEVADVTENPYAITGLKSNTPYEVQVQPVYDDDTTGDWTPSTPVAFTTLFSKETPTEVAADNITDTSADISWTVNGSETEWNIRYRVAQPTFECDFEEEADTEGWNMIDADGDGNNWTWHYNGEDGRLTCNGEGCIYSESFSNASGSALTPNNWLVTPKVTLGGTFSFVALGQDASWAAEVFAVYVSTTSNSDVSTFTKISDDITATADITTYTFDLSAFEGQEGYVAIRHYNVSDMFILNIDDVTIEKFGDWIEVKGVTENPYTLTGLDPETTYEVQVQPVYDDDTTGDWTESAIFTTQVATGINAANTEAEGAVKTYYNLQGVKMSGKPTQRGVYIVNGRKVVIK